VISIAGDRKNVTEKIQISGEKIQKNAERSKGNDIIIIDRGQ